MEFSTIESYNTKAPGNYVPVADATITECNLTPAATCAKVGSNLIKFTLLAAGDSINGNIGKIKNPYSVL
mgnify:FL=1